MFKNFFKKLQILAEAGEITGCPSQRVQKELEQTGWRFDSLVWEDHRGPNAKMQVYASDGTSLDDEDTKKKYKFASRKAACRLCSS
jgi:hypothetical protein